MSKSKKEPIVTLPDDDEVIVTGSFLPPEPMPDLPPEDEGNDELDRDDDECDADDAVCSVEVDIDRSKPIEVLDWQARAKTAVYSKSKKNKRRRFPPVNLSRREVYLVVHQTAFEWRPDNPMFSQVTAQYVALPDARLVQLHPHNCKLVASNWADVRPAFAINLEVAGNFETIDGGGEWFKPERFGRGRATDAQLWVVGEWLRHMKQRAAIEGWKIKGVIPHHVASAGKGQCPGSRVWQAAEAAAIRLKLPVPGDKPVFRKSGVVMDPRWHCEAYNRGEGLRIK
jgi:hypothetical protein